MKKLIVMLFAVAAAFPGQAAAQVFNERIAFDFCSLDFNEEFFCQLELQSTDGLKNAFFDDAHSPAWSPDGSRLVLVGFRQPGMFLLNLGDWSTRSLRNSGGSPAWSPDGLKIAFSDGELHVMGVDGSNDVQLTNNVGFRGNPAWSRDGGTIAFDCEVESGNRDVCAVNADGTGFRRLTTDPGSDSGAAFSPDGITIAFATTRFSPGSPQIAFMNLNGTGIRQPVVPAFGFDPAWSPDGANISFARGGVACDPAVGCNAPDSIFVMRADGVDQRRLGSGDRPAWGLSLRPVAFFLHAPACPSLNCDFDASASWGGNGSIVSYGWNFGDGTTFTTSVPTTVHHYTSTGQPTVTLTVTDNAGVTGTLSRFTNVTLPPIARFTSVCSGLQCTFDASASSDPDGSIQQYVWDFGDGSSSTGPIVTHTYSVANTFTVELFVIDNVFADDQVAQLVTVGGGNVLPVASFTFTCSVLTCAFNASGSSDPDGTITSYAWNFGDGTSASGVTANHTYANGGTFPVSLSVTDNAGATNGQTRNVTAAVPGIFNRVEQNSGQIQYTGSWYSNTSTGNSGGSAYLALSDATATFNFSGTAARWLGLKDGWAGIANVYVDGVFSGTVDTYSNGSQYQSVLFTTTGLSAGNHTLRIEATGQKNPASAQAWIWVDAFEFIGAGGGGGTPDFTLTASPASATVAQGGSSIYTVTVTPANGFNGTVSLGVTGLGAGASAGFNPSTISGSGSSTLTLSTTGASQTGSFSLVITGSNGNLNRSTTVQLTVIASGPPPTTATRIEQDNPAIQYAGAWYTNSSSGNSGGSAFLALNNASATISFSGTGVRWIGLRDAWAGIANVFVDGVFQGAVDTYTGGSQYQSVLYATTGLSAGPHTLRIEATGQKNPASAQAWIWVDAFEFTSGGGGGTPDFTVTASPASASVVQGGSATYTVTVSPANGFNGTVSLSASGLGAGATASFNPLTISGSGSSTLTVNTTATSQTGPFSLVIAGSSGNLNRSTTVQLTVVAAATTTWTRVEQSDAAIEYTGTWYSNGSSGNSGGSAFLALNNASATFSFSGTGVRWIGLRDAWAGIANVYLDGVFQGAVDTYPGTSQYQSVLYEAAGLSAGIHTLRVEATGQKNPASAQAWIWVDAFEFSSAGGSSLPSTSAASGANVQLASVTAGDPTVHIAYLGSEGTQYRNTWTALVTIVVHDTTDRPVPNATVSGVWSLGETASCTTDGSGRCVVSSSTIPRRIQSVTFTIADVTSFMALYREGDNHGPDGDSTSIRVRVKEH